MITVTVRHTAAIAHRIIGLGKCENVHGHGLKIAWTFNAPDLHHPEAADFGHLKRTLHAWVDRSLDHGFICHDTDPIGDYLDSLGLKVYRLPYPPSTEAIASDLALHSQRLLPDLELLNVTVDESDKNTAAWAA